MAKLIDNRLPNKITVSIADGSIVGQYGTSQLGYYKAVQDLFTPSEWSLQKEAYLRGEVSLMGYRIWYLKTYYEENRASIEAHETMMRAEIATLGHIPCKRETPLPKRISKKCMSPELAARQKRFSFLTANNLAGNPVLLNLATEWYDYQPQDCLIFLTAFEPAEIENAALVWDGFGARLIAQEHLASMDEVTVWNNIQEKLNFYLTTDLLNP